MKKVLPIAIALVIIVVIAVLAPWHDIFQLLVHIPVATLLSFVALSAVYYGVKVVRFWVMLGQLGINKPFKPVALAYLSSQLMSQLPGGELYRTVALERIADVPLAKSSPTITMQGLVEAIAMIVIALIGALIIGHEREIVGAVALILALFVVAVRKNWLMGKEGLINKLPFVQVSRTKYNQFIAAHKVFMEAKNLMVLFALSLVAIASAILILFLASQAVGAPLSLPKASIAYCLPVVLSGLSFLPAGLGASETSSIGLLRLLNISTAASVTITLLLRIFTLGAGLVYGLVFLVIDHLVIPKKKRKQ